MSRHQALAAVAAPPLQVDAWLNTPEPLELARLRGQVVVLHAFQMLCPGCLAHGLPQAERLHRLFRDDGVAVIGLHTVFEHHAVMGPEALRVFNHEYRWSFPIGIDRPDPDGDMPLTMRAYRLGGTPSLVLLDRRGRIRLHHLGRLDDLALGAAIGRLLAEDAGPAGAPPA
ncbi:redoxin domain-containing protein [Bordetella bronchiseptica]|uniref:redoxin domain-containing protein n=1 Tax=Bordetella bronchiseptica TaxID=518 RepID=UPI000459F6F3|nr:redoxin domain-containing protein [Bordetella bronchiseptica]AOB27138.1 alkyl hydroperoxide reductase [Bordetella bronchiseptica]AWP75462.1 alkyl hydroperoxide reductase [Bordetella bronchiseptica]AZW44450.1 alkyl hydroperoxide reductase [Bordetella bronchiseptica]KCV66612.1 antioxidant, AhpC/TSA family [Bordetella bronchiseptica 99-R-0433]KDB97346.1 antioxidant, AhpC/TSA family [Bordetella bronchiseptica E010]